MIGGGWRRGRGLRIERADVRDWFDGDGDGSGRGGGGAEGYGEECDREVFWGERYFGVTGPGGWGFWKVKENGMDGWMVFLSFFSPRADYIYDSSVFFFLFSLGGCSV